MEITTLITQTQKERNQLDMTDHTNTEREINQLDMTDHTNTHKHRKRDKPTGHDRREITQTQKER